MSSAVAEARRVLRRGGLLLDLHPADEPTALEVWHARYKSQDDTTPTPENPETVQRERIGWLDHDRETLRDFAATTDALADALEAGFRLERSATFEYQYFFDSLDELSDYLEDNWEHATASEKLLEQAMMVLARAATPPKLVVVQTTAISALRKV